MSTNKERIRGPIVAMVCGLSIVANRPAIGQYDDCHAESVVKVEAQDDDPSRLQRIQFADRFTNLPNTFPWTEQLANHGLVVTTLLEPRVLQELVSKERQRELLPLLSDYHAESRTIHTAFRWDNEGTIDRSHLVEELSTLNALYDRLVSERLTAEESHRLGELYLWNQVRQHGLSTLLWGTSLKDELELTSGQVDAFKDVQDQIVESLVKGGLEIESHMVEQLLEPLDPRTQRQAEQWLFADDARSRLTRPTTKALRQTLDYTPRHYDVILSSKYCSDPWRDFLFTVYDQRTHYDGNLHQFIAGQLAPIAELDPRQRREMNNLIDTLDIEVGLLKVELPDWNDRSSPDRDEFIRKMREQEDLTSQRILDDVLDAAQRELVLRHHYIALTRSYGPLPMLTDGSLAQALEVSVRQRDQMFERAEELAVWVEEESIRLHEQADDAILGVLNADQRARVRQMLGEHPSFQFREDISERAAFLKRYVP